MEEKEKLFKEKAENYLLCYCDDCPQHGECLHWEVGTYADEGLNVVTCVNRRWAKVKDGPCPFFAFNQPVHMFCGMKNQFYRNMPAHIAVSIKKRLIAHNCRATYYKYHNGQKPIPPHFLEFIQQVCQEEGWTQPLRFDCEVEDYVWQEN